MLIPLHATIDKPQPDCCWLWVLIPLPLNCVSFPSPDACKRVPYMWAWGKIQIWHCALWENIISLRVTILCECFPFCKSFTHGVVFECVFVYFVVPQSLTYSQCHAQDMSHQQERMYSVLPFPQSQHNTQLASSYKQCSSNNILKMGRLCITN